MFEVNGGLPVHRRNTNVGCVRGALGTHLRSYGLRGHRDTRSGDSRLARAGGKRLAALPRVKTYKAHGSARREKRDRGPAVAKARGWSDVRTAVSFRRAVLDGRRHPSISSTASITPEPARLPPARLALAAQRLVARRG
jgi:hypothetical protein